MLRGPRERNPISLSLCLFLPTHRASSSYHYTDLRRALRLAVDGPPVSHTASRCGFIECTKIRVLFDRDTRVLLSPLAISPPSKAELHNRYTLVGPLQSCSTRPRL
ncbi:hypothetical protein F5Y09DRAFT_335990 [Xylaria sp. FL1042]|nr:hypothetical protein F5Y09DRAFT_335990 [Xylaria sp. FL1042]